MVTSFFLLPATAQELIYQENFNTDGDGTRYFTRGRGFVFDSGAGGPAFWTHNFDVTAQGRVVGVPAVAPARRAVLVFHHLLPETSVTAEGLNLIDNTIKWLTAGKAKIRVLFSPPASGDGDLWLVSRLTTQGHTVTDDDPAGPLPAAADYDLVIQSSNGVPNPTRFTAFAVPMVTFNASNHDDELTSSIGQSGANFDPGEITWAAPNHPIAGGKTARFPYLTEAQPLDTIGSTIPTTATVVATYRFDNPDTGQAEARPLLVAIDTGAGLLGGVLSGFEGRGFFAGADMNDPGIADCCSSAAEPRDLTLKPVRVTGKKDVRLTVALAATDVDFETSDFLRIMIDLDGDGPAEFTELVNFTPPSDAVKFFSDGTTRLGIVFKDVSYPIPDGATDLVVRFESISTFFNEIVGFDNVRIHTGPLPPIDPPVDPVRITSIKPSGSDAGLVWTGGRGPYLVQKKIRFADAMWNNLKVTHEKTAAISLEGNAGFVRIMDNTPGIPMSVALSGAAERPAAVNTAGSGSGMLFVEGDILTFNISYSGLSGAATAAHIHGPASAGEAAGVMISLAPFNGGAFGTAGVLAGSVALTGEQKSAILSGKTYVNVHTPANGGGEIRGQVAPILFQATLNGASEQPPVTTAGSGNGMFMLTGKTLSFNINYTGLSGVATASHIHGPAPATGTAGVMVNFQPFNGGAFGAAGTFSGSVELSADQLAALLDGLTYFNIHTAVNGGGEIRGQLTPAATAMPLTAILSGAAERPAAVTSTGKGSGTFSLEGNNLAFNITYSNMGGVVTAAHIHGPASAADAAGVMISFAPFNGGAFGTAGTISGTVALTPDQKAAIMGGKTYANLHTAANPGGEIRGQIMPVLLRANLSGDAERPQTVSTPGSGFGLFTLVGDQLSLNVNYAGLKAVATAAHIHGPAPSSAAAGVLQSMVPFHGGALGTAGTFAGKVTLEPAQLSALVDGLTYFNIHTSVNPGGEVRGQITP